MEKFQEVKTWYINRFESFERGLNGESKKPIHKFRKQAAGKIPELSFPTIRDEEWRYTDVSPVLVHKFDLYSISSTSDIIKKQIEPFLFNNSEYITLVFVNGIFNAGLSNIPAVTENVLVMSLKEAFEKHQSIVENYIGKNTAADSGIFSEMNSAFLSDGAFILIRKNTVVEQPIHILYLSSTESEIIIQPRNLIILEDNTRASIIENYETILHSLYFTNAVTEVTLGKNANLNHVRIQNESTKAFHISLSETAIDSSSVYTYYNLDFGGKLARNNFNAKFVGQDAECNLNGLYLLNDGQTIDNHTMIDHKHPRCRSNELYKGVLSGKSRAVFNGKVMVRKDSQKTNAFQSNKNILLSNNAIVDTKPQLEIFADDVKCSHGATIGQLDEEALFYLRSRGFSLEQARRTLVSAFAENVVENISHKAVLDYLEQIIQEKLRNENPLSESTVLE